LGPMIKPQPPFVFSAEAPKEVFPGDRPQEAVRTDSSIIV
jgi:hypothetical protein